MPAVLTTASAVECDHSGSVATTSSAKLTVDGSPVLIFPTSVASKAISACSTVPLSDASGAVDVPCYVVGATLTPGAASKLTAGGQPVALDTLSGTTNGMVGKEVPQSLATPDAAQSRLSAE